MSSKKIVKARFVIPGMEKIRKEVKFLFFGPMNIYIFFTEIQKWFVGFFKYPKRHNISLTLPKQKK